MEESKAAESIAVHSANDSKEEEIETKRDEKSKEGHIILHCRSRSYAVDAHKFAACSTLIQKELKNGSSFPRHIHLSHFDSCTIRLFANFIHFHHVKAKMTYFTLAELLKLANTFGMKELDEKLEGCLRQLCVAGLEPLTQCLLIIALTAVAEETEEAILQEGAANYTRIIRSKQFQSIPYNIVMALVARCDLNVVGELEVADSVLLWLAGQPCRSTLVPGVFFLLRHHLLHPLEKAFILERAHALRFSSDCLVAIRRSFNSSHGARVCSLVDHSAFPRCGQVMERKMKGEPLLPLSVSTLPGLSPISTNFVARSVPQRQIFYQHTPLDSSLPFEDDDSMPSSSTKFSSQEVTDPSNSNLHSSNSNPHSSNSNLHDPSTQFDGRLDNSIQPKTLTKETPAYMNRDKW